MPVFQDKWGNYYFNASALSANDSQVFNAGAGLTSDLTAISPSPRRVIWGQGKPGYTLDTAQGPLNAGSVAYPQILAQSAIPFILAGGTAGASTNQFTMGNNGAISTLPVLPTTYSGGAWIYMPAAAIDGANVAGWYWFVASSTTAGTVFNNRYVSGDPRAAIPATPTPFVSTGPGVVTQNTAQVQGPVITVPGGSLGANGLLETWTEYSIANTANFKTMSASFAGNSSPNAGVNNNLAGALVTKLQNRNSAAINTIGRSGGYSSWNVGGAIVYTTINTAVDFSAAVNLQIGAVLASEFIILEGWKMIVQYGA